MFENRRNEGRIVGDNAIEIIAVLLGSLMVVKIRPPPGVKDAVQISDQFIDSFIGAKCGFNGQCLIS